MCPVPADVIVAGVERSPAACAVLDRAGEFEWVNRAFCDLVGRSCQDLERRSFASITHPHDVAHEQEAFTVLVAGPRDTYVTEKRYVRPDEGEVWIRLTCVRLGDEPVQVFATGVDITEQKRDSAALAHRAAHDELTGLPARGLFLELLSVALRRLERSPRREWPRSSTQCGGAATPRP